MIYFFINIEAPCKRYTSNRSESFFLSCCSRSYLLT
ncbi:unnamed protein product [Acanthoscelides obtectus]|uniref:Uncharacterized protein n=1 Tax=Acanthoscelides obtectus TaxID=200917 RepID=A0A9P0LG68_ACAOB|nr:unnamed protein product [Acanthoscelides obtectus]CAK1632943.1 hypothetical protein AOBTE_LOCUS7838 [Acanthoscelides obtectus]